MKAFKNILSVLAAIAALAGIAIAAYYAVQHFLGEKKSSYYDDEDFFECDCDCCDDLCEQVTPEMAAAPEATDEEE